MSWKRNPNVVARRIGDETILVPTGRDIVEQRRLFTLNETGSHIWNVLEVPRTTEQILVTLVDEFDVPREQAERDLGVFLAEMVSARCIVEF